MSAPIWRRIGFILSLAAAAAVGFLVRPHVESPAETCLQKHKTLQLKPGPWGDLEIVPITISAPSALLPVQGFESENLRWRFLGMTPDDFAGLVKDLELPAQISEQLLGPPAYKPNDSSVELQPGCDLVQSLSAHALETLYPKIDSFDNQTLFIPVEGMDERFRRQGASSDTIAAIKRQCIPYGKFLVLHSLPCVLAGISDFKEKIGVVKALTQQQTFLMKLRVGPKSDVNALADYWGRAFWTTDVKAILESLEESPGGSTIDVIELLPPLPTSLLYTFPVPQNSMNKPVVAQNCYWTALNFFRDNADDRFAETDYAVEALKADYYPVPSDPRYGDVVLFMLPDRTAAVHAAVYIADDIVFTKNGPAALFPWAFARLSDLIDRYSFNLPHGQRLKLQYFRNKYY